MNFQGLNKIENSATLLDIAFRAARTREKPKFRGELIKKVQTRSISEVETVTLTLKRRLGKIVEQFPRLKELPRFYLELAKTTLDYGEVKKSLAAVQWAEQQVSKLGASYKVKMKKARQPEMVKRAKREFYGRVSSVVKQVDKHLKTVDHARLQMKRYPAIKTSLYTVAIAGYPNVGKSSLLKSMTTAEPKIREYAFTTQDLNIGYLGKIQLIDTPGTFNRDKMNRVEEQAYLVLRHLARLVVFVIDGSESCGYPVSRQQKLLTRIKKMDIPVLTVYSKADLARKDGLGRLNVSVKTHEGLAALKRLIKKHEADSQRKDDQC